jgi:hypothetical protein
MRDQFLRLRLRLFVAAPLLAGCMKEPPPYSDTVGAVAPAQSTAAADSSAPSNIGKLGVLAQLSPDGKCTVEQLGPNSAVLRNVTYEGDYPVRRITLGVGAADRAYRPINLEAVVRQDAGVGQENNESMRIIFLPDGGIRSGVRAYSGPSGQEQVGLFPDDSARVKALASEVLDLCKDHD